MSDTPSARAFRYPIWCRGDLDGFFGLMVDNLAQVLLIVTLCKYAAGLPNELIFGRILPGVAISLIVGNLFYGLQAHWVARRYRNGACTALPYGINTPSVFAFVLFIMAPVYQETGDSTLAWKAGLLACLVSGAIEFSGAFFAEKLRRATPRAALLGVLAAVGITFIAADFAFRIWTRPLIGILPLGFLLLAYFARHRFPFRLPGGFLAILFGTGVAWLVTLAEGRGVAAGVVDTWLGGSPGLSFEAVRKALEEVHWIAPVFCGDALMDLLKPENQGLLYRFLVVSVPMGVLNVIGALQNIESAEAGGDRFATGPSLAVNGLGTIGAALFGSCFPTTIYIGHPGWKALGARAGYSLLNGVFFTVCFLFGLGSLLAAAIPIEAGAAIVMYIGIIITAQAFQATPKAHAPAVAIALFPALGAMLITKLPLLMGDAGATRTLAELVASAGPGSGEPALPGIVTLMGANSSWIVLTLVLAAIGATLIDRRYKAAAVWCGAATVLTALGVLHAYRLQGNDVHEYFLWQRTPVATAGAMPVAMPAAPVDVAAGPVTESAPAAAGGAVASMPATAVTRAAPPVFAYRAYPIAIGYGLATVLFTLVAARKRKAEEMGADGAEVEGPEAAGP